jgi:hypothetical protein
LFLLVLDAAGGIDCTSKSSGDHFWNQMIANCRSICMAVVCPFNKLGHVTSLGRNRRPAAAS